MQKKLVFGNNFFSTSGVMSWIPREQQQAEFTSRKARAAKAASDISSRLNLGRREKLVNVVPEIYGEEAVDPVTRVKHAVEGSGALVVRAFIDKRVGRGATRRFERREEQIWIDDNHRELPEDSTTVLGAIANDRAGSGPSWLITHFTDPLTSNYVTPRERALGLLAPVIPMEQTPEALAAIPSIPERIPA
jgi:hypothetical protein